MMHSFLLINDPPFLLLDTVRLSIGRILVGRSSAADIFLQDKTISRKHAEIHVCGLEITVRDLDSINGTFVDDVQILESAHVRPGQHLRFGRVSFELARQDSKPFVSRFQEISTEKWKQSTPSQVAKAVQILTPAQRAIFNLLLDGKSHNEIAKSRHLSQHTVHNHLRRIYEAFGVHSRADLLAFVMRPIAGTDNIN